MSGRDTKDPGAHLKAVPQKEREAQAFDQDAFIHENLIEICDLLGEAIAEAAMPGPGAFDPRTLGEINRRVWTLRWELGMSAGHSVGLVREEQPEHEATE